MNQIVNYEDPLSDFEMSFLDIFPQDQSIITNEDIANKTPSLFFNYDLPFALNNITSTESTTTSITSSPDNNFRQLNSKNTLLASPLQHNTEVCPTMVNHQHHRNNSTNHGSDIFTYDYTTNKPKNNKYRINKPTSVSPLLRPPLKPSVTIANIDTLSQLEVKSSKVAIPKTNVGNPFYKSPIEGKSMELRASMNNNDKKLPKYMDSNIDNEEEQVIYDLLVDTNISNITCQNPILETKFKMFDDNLIFDDLFDNPQQMHLFIKDNIPWRI